MKRFLALLLAALMLAAGTVSALAEEGTGTPPTEEDSPVQEDAPITIDGCFPGGTIRKTWSIYAPNNSQGLLVDTDMEIKSYSHTNIDEIGLADRLSMGTFKQFLIRLKKPLTSEEDVGKEINDTITVTLENDETYTFYLVIRYRAGAKIEQKGEHWNISRFTLGQKATLSMNIIDPQNTFELPYEIEVEQQNADGTLIAPEDCLLEIGEIQTNGLDFTITVNPIKAGKQTLHVFATDANGSNIGKGWAMEVSEDGNFTPDARLVEDSYEGPSDNSANTTETVSALQEVTVALETGSAELPKNAVTVTTASGESVTAIPVKLSSGSAAISFDTANALGESKAALSARVDNGAMEVILPGGFGQVTEPGRIYYPFDFDRNPSIADEMKSAVKEEDARSEAVKAGGNMVLPTTATVTLRTKLEDGPVNIYYYNEETKKYTRLASATITDGYVTFATRQMGHMVLTTGTI